VPTYHIEDAACIDMEGGSIAPVRWYAHHEERREHWLPDGAGPLTIGVTAGASTPNNKIGETIERIAALRGVTLHEVLANRVSGIFRALCRCPASSSHRALVCQPLRRADRATAPGLAGNSTGRRRFDRRSHRLGKTFAAFLSAIDGLVRQD